MNLNGITQLKLKVSGYKYRKWSTLVNKNNKQLHRSVLWYATKNGGCDAVFLQVSIFSSFVYVNEQRFLVVA